MKELNYIAVKKVHLTNERWDVLARGLNRAMMDLDLNLRFTVESTENEDMGECVLFKIFEKEKK